MVHHFEPRNYYTTIGPHEPALYVKDGDTVETSTVDASGKDHTDSVITPRGNPQTGPFHIEGAEPGDTLVIHLDKLTPNRAIGWTRPLIAANVLDPDYVRQTAGEITNRDDLCRWQINLERSQATLIDPTDTGLGQINLDLAPMIGCFGVAPEKGQMISTATSSNHGGNMDYRGFVEGVTVYFPVFTPGALFHIGDGHALQGDGEIVGTGIEISFDFRFTIRLLKSKQIIWPRGENDTYLFTVGNARPLDQCVQHATTEMLRWLQVDFGLDPRAAHTLLGQCVEYDMGNIFDPAYTMVCKVKKKLLESIGIDIKSIHNSLKE